MTATLGLEVHSDRCPAGFAAVQHPTFCACPGLALKSAGQSLATAAHPTEAAAVDAAIRQLAATGGEWSANELRGLVPDARGPIMGARFSAAAKAGLIRDTGRRVPSTLASTHAHEVRVWQGVAA